MPVEELWRQIVAGGTGFFIFIGLILFFRGDLVNGAVARQAKLDALTEQRDGFEAQIALLKQHYDEMQNTWRSRFEAQAKELEYYRSIALSSTRSTEQAISELKGKLERP